MAGITQTIPNYFGGISEQPDQLKNPGQVKEALNTIPDLTYGLYKRPGSKRIISTDTASGALQNVQSNGSWFHYYRDETEGSYIGQIASDGAVRVWRCSDAKEMTVAYGSTDGANATNLKAYLTPSSASATEDLQTLTINDTTFVNNRTKVVSMTSDKSPDKPDAYTAFVEITRTENGRQYSLNINDGSTGTTTIKSATRVKISATSLSEDWGTGNCPGIGTQVFSGNETNTLSRKNLTFRITTVGQTGESKSSSDDGSTNESSFRCTYNRQVDLLHGGEDWEDGDTTTVTMDVAQTNYTYTVEVTEHEESAVKVTINSGANGLIRPAPTPWDSQCAVTTDAILGGIAAELSGTGLSYSIVGNGIYISSSSAFNVEVLNPDLMRVMQDQINDVTELPSQCKHGYIVKVANSKQSDEDDYYMKFTGTNDKDGPGAWVECAEPDIHRKIDAGTMPVTIQRTAATTFTVDRYAWDERVVGDQTTNPIPSFVKRNTAYGHSSNVDAYINKVLFFRNRLCFLTGNSIVTSQPGDFGNFWADTALTVSNIDPVDISTSSILPSDLYDAVEINTGLLAFTTNAQYLLATDDAVFNPDTAKLRAVSNYNYNKVVPPINIGTTVGFLDNSNKYSRFVEAGNIAREGQGLMVNQTKVVPTLLSKDVDLLANSIENGLVIFGETDKDTVVGWRHVTIGNQRQQTAWFKWKFNNPIKYHFFENDKYYFLDTDNFLQQINIVQATADPSIDEEGTNFLIHLDNWTTVQGGVYNATTNLTTFTDGSGGCEFTWQSSVTSPNGTLVVVDVDTATARVGRYAAVTVTSAGATFTLPGDWSGATLHIGYLYDYQVDFPRLYTVKQVGQSRVADVNASLVLHRLKLSLGKAGLYETTLNRIGKDPYTQVYESTFADFYNVSDAPYIDEYIKTVPVYDKTDNVDITLKSTHPSPCTLRSLSWEGDYSPMFYTRA